VVGKFTSFLPLKRDVYQFKRFIDVSDGDEVIKLKKKNYKPFFVKGDIIYTGGKTKVVCFAANALDEGIAISGPDMDLLAPGLFYFKCCGVEDIITYSSDHVLTKVKGLKCFVGYTSGKELNKNFTRLMSIFPLTLQAKGFSLLSIVLSLVLISMDILSTPFNSVWQKFKIFIYKYTKLSISLIEDPKKREIIHTFLQTISQGFMYCDVVNKKSYNVKCNGLILNDFHYSKIKDDGYTIFNFRDNYGVEIRDFFSFQCNINNCLYESILVPDHGNDSVECRYSWRAGGIEYFNEFRTLDEISNLYNLFDFINKNKGVFLVESIKEDRIHIPSPKQLFYQSSANNNVLFFKEEKKLFLSAFEIIEPEQLLNGSGEDLVKSLSVDKRCKMILKKYPSEKDLVLKLFIHNFLYFKGAKNFFLIEKLLQSGSAPYKIFGLGNSEWKKYSSDFSLLLIESGRSKLSSSCIVNPSLVLGKMKNILQYISVENLIDEKNELDSIAPARKKTENASGESSEKVEESPWIKAKKLCEEIKSLKDSGLKRDPKCKVLVKSLFNLKDSISFKNFEMVKLFLSSNVIDWGEEEKKSTKREFKKEDVEKKRVIAFKNSYKDCLMKTSSISRKEFEVKGAIKLKSKTIWMSEEVTRHCRSCEEKREELSKVKIISGRMGPKEEKVEVKINDLPVFKKMLSIQIKRAANKDPVFERSRVGKELREYKSEIFGKNSFDVLKSISETKGKGVLEEIEKTGYLTHSYTSQVLIEDPEKKNKEELISKLSKEISSGNKKIMDLNSGVNKIRKALTNALKNDSSISIKSKVRKGDSKNKLVMLEKNHGSRRNREGRGAPSVSAVDMKILDFICYRLKGKKEKNSNYGNIEEIVVSKKDVMDQGLVVGTKTINEILKAKKPKEKAGKDGNGKIDGTNPSQKTATENRKRRKKEGEHCDLKFWKSMRQVNNSMLGVNEMDKRTVETMKETLMFLGGPEKEVDKSSHRIFFDDFLFY
jgi:hypothetical protein